MVLSISIHFLSLILFLFFFSLMVRSERSHKKQLANHYHGQNRKQTDFKVRKYHHSHNFSFEDMASTPTTKFDNHVSEVSRKVSLNTSSTRAHEKRQKKMLPLELRRDLYLSFNVPRFNFCSETWRFCSKVEGNKRVSHRICIQRQAHLI